MNLINLYDIMSVSKKNDLAHPTNGNLKSQIFKYLMKHIKRYKNENRSNRRYP